MMLALVFGDSHAERGSSRRGDAPRGQLAWALGLLGGVLLSGVFACGGNDNGDTATVALADSGSLAGLTSRTLDIPTGVAVPKNGDQDGDIAWVAESQFDHYTPFVSGAATPAPFRLVGVPLTGGMPQQISLPDNFFPEGITASPSGRLYVGSIADGRIQTVAPGATTAEDFLPAKTLSKTSVLGMATSGDGSILWVCNTETSTNPPTASIIGIGAADRQIKATHDLPPSSVGAFCNDMVIAANGTLWATESFGGRLFRIAAGELLNNAPATAWLQASELSGPNGPEVGQFGANGLALVSGKLFVVNSSRGTLLDIDPTLSQPGSADLHTVALTETDVPGPVVLANPDGITRVSDTDLLVVENGFYVVNNMVVDRGGKRLTRVSLATK